MASDLDDLQSSVWLIGEKLEAPKSLLSVRDRSPEDGSPHVEFKGDGFDYVSSEKGCEIFRKHTGSMDELLFWILSGVAFDMAVEYELHHRVVGEDSRRVIFEKYISSLNKIDAAWARKASDELDVILLSNPFVEG
jgi:hypothetical protein